MQLVVNTAIYAAAVLLSALGFRLVYVTGRFFHFAHAITIPLGAYTTWLLMTSFGMPFVLAAGLAALVTGLLGSGLFLGTLAPLLDKGAGPQVLLLASLAIFFVAQHGLAVAFGDDAHAVTGTTAQAFEFFGGRATGTQVATVAVAVACAAAVWATEAYTRAGAQLLAVAEHAELSRVFGIDVRRVQAIAFAAGSGLGGVLGALIAADQSFAPDMGFQWLLPGVVAVLLGRVWHVGYVVLAACLVAALRTSAIWFLGGAWQNVLIYALLFAYFAAKPTRLAAANPLG